MALAIWWTKERLAGIMIALVYTIAYIVIFWIFDNNWIDIFHNFKFPNIKW